ncbi:NPCBM/NEW2 domain-containing protein [Streptomyces sp. APSN-46.1]|uniref:NPCBM/NEW2 domain-containing protein n=1 Tax=Streptomyces sp. APSN-46.1 TaxID=2929049 RepID=UPI001FB4976A|nr:NPCBM/NEW2 domain-containing protein [Streptomyces sp. APSN-46.1]MCJ1676154.1 NPCBM/NEW2 domain-containing protein [Streptomyces sp. APSN-46.1]
MRRTRITAALGAVLLGALATVVPPATAPAAAESLPPGGTPMPTHPIVPGAAWSDDTGRLVQAHGAGIFKVGSTYYMVGEDKEAGQTYHAVACYSSKNLTDWHHEGSALSRQADGDLGPNRVVERPKVIYNDKSRQYVMYLHIEDKTYQEAKVGVATSPTPCGPYTYRGSERPLGFQSRDIGLFKDDDGTGYLLTEDREHGLRIDKLSDDYLTVESNTALVAGFESPAMAKVDGRYFLFGSYLTGWSTNDNVYATAPSPAGPWSEFKNFAPAGSRTFDSQTSSIVPVTGSRGTTYMYVGDRWNPQRLFDSKPVWLPLHISGTTANLSWQDSWSLDTASGTWAPQNADSTYEAEAAGNTLTGEAVRSGGRVGYVGMGSALRFNNVTVPHTGTYTLKIAYSNGDADDRKATLKADGGAPMTLSFPPTGGDRTGVATATVTLTEGAHTLEFGNATGWAPDFDRIALPNGPSTSLGLTGRPTYPGSPVVLANAGADNPLSVTFTNHGPTATVHPAVSVTAPDGWTVSRAGSPTTGTVGAGRSTSSSWTVKPPAGTAPGTYELKATAAYRWNGELPATIDETIKVTVPPPAPAGTPYVSDLPVMSWLVGWGALQRDLSPGALPMVIEGVPYAKGLGAHAKSTAHFYLGGACRSFSAVVGIDDEDGPRGSVIFEVWADGKKVAETGVVRGTDPGLPLTADVTGATELELRATDANDGNHYDHSEWADARLTC